jgi:transcriptional regulator with XRE-family HTH domain
VLRLLQTYLQVLGARKTPKSIRAIARRTGLSRNTIRKYLRSDAVEPVFRTPDRPSKLDPFAERLAAWWRGRAAGTASARTRAVEADLRSRETRDAVERDVARQPDPVAELRDRWSRD